MPTYYISGAGVIAIGSTEPLPNHPL